MVDTISMLAKGGAGPGYPKGNEVFIDLSAQGGTPYAMTAAHIGRTLVLHSGADGQAFKFLAANNASLAPGKGVGIVVAKKSRPIKILNGGTAGTDPILEAFLMPGAAVTFILTSASAPSAAAGTWTAYGSGMFAGPVPVTLPSVEDPGIDFGSVVNYSATCTGSANGNNALPGQHLARVNSTTYAWGAPPNAGTSIVGYGLIYNHATDAWTWSTGTTIFSSANSWYGPMVAGINGNAVYSAFETTTDKLSMKACTFSGATQTFGSAIQSGGWGCNPTGSGQAQWGKMSIIPDNVAGGFFQVYPRYDDNNSHFGVNHFTLSGGTTLAQDGGYTTTMAAGDVFVYGASLQNNKLVTGETSDGTNGVGIYTYNAGAITVSNVKGRGNTATGGVFCVDTANRVFIASAGMAATGNRFVLNASYTDMKENDVICEPSPGDYNQPPTGFTWWLSEDEGLNLAYGSGSWRGFTLFNVHLTARIRKGSPAASGYNAPITTTIVPAQLAYGGMASITMLNGYVFGVDINWSIRRMAMVYGSSDQSLAVNRRVRAAMFELPRNYDHCLII